MFNGNITQSLDRNYSLSLFYSRRTPSKNKPAKKQSKFILPSGEYLSPVKVNTTTPYNSTTTPVLVHSLSDMSLKNDNVDRLEPDDSPTPARRYSIITPKSKSSVDNINNNKNILNSLKNPIPLYPNTIPQKLNIKSNSTSKIEGNQNVFSLPKFQRKSRMSLVVSERKPVNLFTNMSQKEKDMLSDISATTSDKDENSNEKNQMNLDVQGNDLDDCPCSNGFLNNDGIWEDPTLSQSESRCLQMPTVGNIMINNENNNTESLQDQIDNSNDDKTLLWEFEDANKYNDKENIIPDGYKGGILAEREWCDSVTDEDSVMGEYDNNENEFTGSSSQTTKFNSKSNIKGKRSNSMIKKSEYQCARYVFQEISVNSMPEYQMNSADCYSVYSNSSFGSNYDSQKMTTPKKCNNFKMSNSFSKSNDFNNTFNNNDNIDNTDSTPSFFNTLPLIKNMNANASSSSSNKKSVNSKKLVYQLCGVPDINAIYKTSMTKSKDNNNNDNDNNNNYSNNNNNNNNIGNELPFNTRSSLMNSSPVISKSSILSPPFLLSSPILGNSFSSPLVQSKNNYSFNDNPFEKKDTNLSLDEITPKANKVKSLLTTSIHNSLSPESSNMKIKDTKNLSQSDNDLLLNIDENDITPRADHNHNNDIIIPEDKDAIIEDHTKDPDNTVFFPHYYLRQRPTTFNGEKSIKGEVINKNKKESKMCDDSFISQTSNMMSISPTTLSKINQSHQNFIQMVTQKSSSTVNYPKRNKICVDDKKKELHNRRRTRVKKYGF